MDFNSTYCFKLKQKVTGKPFPIIGTRIQRHGASPVHSTYNVNSRMKSRSSLYIFLGLFLAGMGGCGTGATSPASTPTVAQATLDSARAAYDAGDYRRTIALLGGHAREIDGADVNTQVAAHKLLAFSYCLTRRTTQCRAEFSRILDLNPRFDLSPAEKGHPIWGPAFEYARRKHALS